MRVARGTSFLSRVAGHILCLPCENSNADVRLTITRSEGVQVWTRTFDGIPIVSQQRHIASDAISEVFGRIEFLFRLEREPDAIRYRQTGAYLRLGPVRIPLPAALAPRVEALERQTGTGRLTVRVRVTWPPAGLLLEYDGDVHGKDRLG